jgi:hypothetical protein
MNFQTLLKSLLILFVFMVSGVACMNCGSGKFFKVIDYGVDEVRATSDSGTGAKDFTPGATLDLKKGDEIKSDEVGFRFAPVIETIASIGDVGNIFGLATACDPAPAFSQEIIKVHIISNTDFVTADSTYQAGVDLSDVFAFFNQALRLEETLADINIQTSDRSHVLIIRKAPFNNQSHRFAFTFHFNDSTSATAQSETITILP